MKLIILDGGPASGKNTLGSLLVEKFTKNGEKTVLLDLDTFVEKYNPNWIWDNKEQEKRDQLQARIDFSKAIASSLKSDHTIIAIGERIITQDQINKFLNMIKIYSLVYLFHLSIPLSLRRKRLIERGPHSLIDLDQDQRDRDAVQNWPGYVYENSHTPEVDAEGLLLLINQNKGLITQ